MASGWLRRNNQNYSLNFFESPLAGIFFAKNQSEQKINIILSRLEKKLQSSWLKRKVSQW
jgi:hypothetical protein